MDENNNPKGVVAMSEIFLPQKIIYGDNSVKKFAHGGFEHVLMLSDKSEPTYESLLESIRAELCKKIPCVECIVESNLTDLRSQAISYISHSQPERLVAVGTAELIDAAMLISYQTGVEFTAVPLFSSCAMTDFDEAEYRNYRKSPCETVLDTEFVKYVNSDTAAYDAFSCFAYAVDSLISCENTVVFSLALMSAADILNNAVGAYRGNYKAIQKLMYSMYYAVLAHRNMLSLSASVIDDVTSFFARLGVSKQTAAAICIPEIMDYHRSDIFAEIARATGLCRSNEALSDTVDRLIERVRTVRAALNIPRSISAICPDRTAFNAFCENSHLPRELLELCYNGSFKLMKL